MAGFRPWSPLGSGKGCLCGVGSEDNNLVLFSFLAQRRPHSQNINPSNLIFFSSLACALLTPFSHLSALNSSVGSILLRNWRGGGKKKKPPWRLDVRREMQTNTQPWHVEEKPFCNPVCMQCPHEHGLQGSEEFQVSAGEHQWVVGFGHTGSPGQLLWSPEARKGIFPWHVITWYFVSDLNGEKKWKGPLDI